MATKKILYGSSNFEAMIQDNGYYVDKSNFIEKIEQLGAKYLLFLRPRRFGKSLFISMLEYYYDISRADQFEELFGHLYIGKNPTPLRNTFPILKFNFSGVASHGTVEDIENSFNLRIFNDLEFFYVKYPEITGGIEVFQKEFNGIINAGDLLGKCINKMAEKKVRYYLLIDEYDNFANNILAEHGKDKYQRLTHGDGFLRNFFTVIKAGTDTRTVERMFAAGVSPLVMSDVTSGFNIGENISQDAIFADMVGFTAEEVETMTDYYISEKVIPSADRERVLETMKNNYNNYCFSEETSVRMYNSNSVLYLMHQYTKSHKMPMDVVDTNMRTDYQKLRFLVVESHKLNGNFNLLGKVLAENEIESELKRDFPVKELIEKDKFVSLLYYLGFLSIKNFTFDGSCVFKIPNDMCREILWEYIRKALKEAFHLELGKLEEIFRGMYRRGEWRPLLEYIFEEFYKAASNRDFIYREEGVKGFLLAYLNISKVYRVHSEKELNKGYADIYIEPNLVVYPEMNPTHLLIELKYLSKDERTESGINAAFNESKKQLLKYAADKKVPESTVKVVAITTNEELVRLEEIR